MFELNLNPELVVGILSGLLAFVFEYIPVASKWFDGLEEVQKKQFMLASLFAVVAVVFAGGCYGLFVTQLACTIAGGVQAFQLLFAAVAINQGVHRLIKKSARG